MNVTRVRRRLLAADRYERRTGHRSLRTNGLNERYRLRMYQWRKAREFREVKQHFRADDPTNCGGPGGPWPPCGGCYHCYMAMVEHYAWKRWMERRRTG